MQSSQVQNAQLIRVIGQHGRITLGAVVAGRMVRIEFARAGVFLRYMTAVPARLDDAIADLPALSAPHQAADAAVAAVAASRERETPSEPGIPSGAASTSRASAPTAMDASASSA